MNKDNQFFHSGFMTTMMFISEFLSDANLGLALLIILVYLMIIYKNRINRFTNTDGDWLNRFETILHMQYNIYYDLSSN